ncbi:MAG: alpha/beta hydrolase [Kordiimonadaceae bacterium]|nr:alpha/beta hydrolase [Kordiimonadaceae bacterium]
MIRKILVGVILILIIVSSAGLYQYHNEDLSTFEEARAASTEKYLDLPLGKTRYQIYGNPNDKTIVLIHSFNGFIESWQPNIGALVQAGYRIVAYDLWGRGLSDRPRIDLTMAVFQQQLADVLDAVGVDNAILVGSSFGCVIASHYALQHPEKVEKLVMIGPAGWPKKDDSSKALLGIPLLGDMLFHYFGQAILRPSVEAYFYKNTDEQALGLWNKYAAFPGFTRSALSSLRHSPVQDNSEGWAKLGTSNVPMVFIWAKQDISFPFENTQKVAELIPQAKIIAVDNAAHWVNIEQADVVNAAIIDFIQSD